MAASLATTRSQAEAESRICEMHVYRLMHFLAAHDLLGQYADVTVSGWVYDSW